MISLLAIGLSLGTIISSGAQDLKSSNGLLSNPQQTVSNTLVVKKNQVLLKKSKAYFYTAPGNDQLRLNFDLYYDQDTNQLVEAYFVGGYGNTSNGQGITIAATTQEGIVTGDCADFSLLFKYTVSGSSGSPKIVFVEPTICLN